MTQVPSSMPDVASTSDGGPAVTALVGLGLTSSDLSACVRLVAQIPAAAGYALLVARRKQATDEQAVLAELRAATTMPVLEAIPGLEIRPNHVYVAPPAATLTVSGA